MSATRKTAMIMVGIMVIEGWVLMLSLGHATQAHVRALYDPGRAGWPACLLAAAIVAVFVWHGLRAVPLIRDRFFDPHPLKLLAIPFALITGSMEELWFRKGVMDAVSAHGGGIALQLLASAMLFGLVHAIWGCFAGRWRVAAGSMIATGVLGAGLALVYLVGDRNVAPCMWAHIVINLTIEPWLLYAAASGNFARRG